MKRNSGRANSANSCRSSAHNYIEEYYQQIISGGVIVGEWVAKWYKLLIEGLQNREFFFDQKKATIAIQFIENFCHHHEGELAPNLIKLELWQKALVSVIFGIMDEDGNRQFREIVLEIGRKNGKTLLAAAITSLVLFLDNDYGKRAYYIAPKLDQARLCYDAFVQMVGKEPELLSEVKKRRTDVYIPATNSSAQPIAFSSKKSDGLNGSIFVCDEVASWQGDAGLKQYEVLKSSLGARRQPLLISISTASYVEDGIWDELMRRSTAVINGTSREKRLAPFLYVIDDPEKWNDIGEVRKANPNLGVSVSVDYMLEEIAVAEQSLSKKTEYLTKYCNIRQNASQNWLDIATIRKSFFPRISGDVPSWTGKAIAAGKINAEGNHFQLADFSRCYGLCGVDLSQTVDLSACTLLVQKDGVIYYFAQFFLPAAKLKEAIARDGIPYDKYIKQGWLKISGENYVEWQDCVDWIIDLVKTYKIYILRVGIDRYCAQYLQSTLESKGFHTETVFQGHNLTGVINTTEGMMKDGTLQSADGNELMKIHWLDAALKLTPERNQRQLIKSSKNAHVDGVAALLDAMCMRANAWEKEGRKLENAIER